MKLKGDFENIDFYSDQNDNSVIYAQYMIPRQHPEDPDREAFCRIDSSEFQSFVEFIIFPQTDGQTSSKSMIKELRNYFNLYGCEDTVSPKIRVAGKLKDELIEYDLNNYNQEYVQITPNEWKLTQKHNNKFLRRKSNATQVSPEKNKKNLFKLLRPYVNASKDDFILFVIWLVQSFCEGSKSILLIMAGKGSGKTTLTRTIRKILDPSKADVCVIPLNSDHLLTTLTNSFLVTLDNTRELDEVRSDILCQAVSGSTYIKRMAYSTNDEAMFTLHNVLTINGINIVPQQSDLAERCLMINLKPIKDKRKSEYEIETEFAQILPEILGCIFDTLSKAMNIITDINPTKRPRMLDSYIEMMAIAKALGVPQEKFEKIYFDNIEKIDKARGDLPLVEAIKEFMLSNKVKGNKFYGTVADAYNKIKDNYSGDKRDLPKSPSHFSRQISAEHHTIFAAGYIVNMDPTHADGTHIEIIKK